MTTTPEISVVMSVCNGEAHLRETVDSVLGQKDADFEFIIVNDGSTDLSASILDELAETDARIKIIHQENQGLTRALFQGCAVARGRYIARQDVGDLSDPERLYFLKQALDENPSVSFVSSWTEYCGPEWEFLYLVRGTGKASQPTFILSNQEEHGAIDGPTHHGAVMFRGSSYEQVGGYRAEFYYGQDWDLWYRLSEAGKFQMIGRQLYRARLTPKSISASSKTEQKRLGQLSLKATKLRLAGKSEVAVLAEVKKIRPKTSIPQSTRTQAQWLYFIGECLRKNNDERSQTYFWKSVRVFPLDPAPWVRLLQQRMRFGDAIESNR